MKFNKPPSLTKKSEITQLFKKGIYLNFIYLICVYQIILSAEGNLPHMKILISVPKNKIKSAVDRNILKRRIQESIRKNQHILNNILSEKNIMLNLAFIYNSNKITKFCEIENEIVLFLEYLKNKI